MIPDQKLYGGEDKPHPKLSKLLWAIRMVESGDREDVKDGDNGKAIGVYQIHKAYWQDSRIPGKYEDCRNRVYATRVVLAYWQRYCPEALEDVNAEVLAKTHNGGWNGPNKKSTEKYWKKVKKYYEQGD